MEVHKTWSGLFCLHVLHTAWILVLAHHLWITQGAAHITQDEFIACANHTVCDVEWFRFNCSSDQRIDLVDCFVSVTETWNHNDTCTLTDAARNCAEQKAYNFSEVCGAYSCIFDNCFISEGTAAPCGVEGIPIFPNIIWINYTCSDPSPESTTMMYSTLADARSSQAYDTTLRGSTEDTTPATDYMSTEHSTTMIIVSTIESETESETQTTTGTWVTSPLTDPAVTGQTETTAELPTIQSATPKTTETTPDASNTLNTCCESTGTTSESTGTSYLSTLIEHLTTDQDVKQDESSTLSAGVIAAIAVSATVVIVVVITVPIVVCKRKRSYNL